MRIEPKAKKAQAKTLVATLGSNSSLASVFVARATPKAHTGIPAEAEFCLVWLLTIREKAQRQCQDS